MALRSERIEYNGTVYDSWADLPPEVQDLVRTRMPDTDGDGIPDVLQGGPVPEPVVTTTYSVDGTEYTSLDELPPDVRAHLQRAMAWGTTPGGSSTGHLAGQPLDKPRRQWWRRLFG